MAALITNLQNAVFRQYGFSSSMALPPCIPLAYGEAPRDNFKLDHELHSFRIDIENYSVVHDCLFLMVTSGAELSELRSYLKNRVQCLPESGDFIPITDGFFLSVDETGSIRKIIDAGSNALTGGVPSRGVPSGGVPSGGAPSGGAPSDNTIRGFSSFSIGLLEIHAAKDAWWNQVDWEIIFEKKARRVA